jgi:hypothetical protein
MALLLLEIFASPVFALERCNQYKREVRLQHWIYWGTTYPYQYGVGQLQQESGCRSSVTAFDAGQGVAQFMPRTEEYCEKFLGPLNMYNTKHAIKAQAWYMRKIHNENWDGALWITYQIYNGGATNLRKEYQRAGVSNHSIMRTVCHRKVITLKSGRKLDFCEVNYDYSKKVFTYGNRYSILTNVSKWRYW